MRRSKWFGLFVAVALATPAVPSAATTGATAATNPASWTTWHLGSADELRLPEPPSADSRKTRRELRQLRRLRSERTPKIARMVRHWNKGRPVLRWTDLALKMVVDHRPRPPAVARSLAILHTGLYDAMVAANDSRLAYQDSSRPKPVVLDARVRPLLGGKRGSSYAPAEVAMAGAAETILPVIFPQEPARTFEDAADAAAQSRLYAGANYRSDVVRARRLGRAIGQLALARLATDPGAESGFVNGPGPEGEEYWSPTPPFRSNPIGGMVGAWQPWLMESGSSLRSTIPGPFAYGSEEFFAETLEVLEVSESLTPAQEAQAFFWDDGPGTFTPPGHWVHIATELIRTPGEPGFSLTKNEAVRSLALIAAVEADAAIASWEAKYFWWSIRPITSIWRLCDERTRLCTEEEAAAAGPEIAPYYGTEDNVGWAALIITPSFPSYPSGHSTFSGGAAKIITYFFPEAGDEINALAQDAADSRLLGGIHFRSDNQDGLKLGRAIADLAITRAESDGSGL